MAIREATPWAGTVILPSLRIAPKQEGKERRRAACGHKTGPAARANGPCSVGHPSEGDRPEDRFADPAPSHGPSALRTAIGETIIGTYCPGWPSRPARETPERTPLCPTPVAER